MLNPLSCTSLLYAKYAKKIIYQCQLEDKWQTYEHLVRNVQYVKRMKYEVAITNNKMNKWNDKWKTVQL